MSTPEQRASRAAYMRAWNAKNPDKVRASKRRSFERNPDPQRRRLRLAMRRWRIRHKYGITPEAVERLMAEQNGSCPICGASATTIDHDHVSGRVRAILCRSCNVGLGHFKDDPARLLQAAAFLSQQVERTGE